MLFLPRGARPKGDQTSGTIRHSADKPPTPSRHCFNHQFSRDLYQVSNGLRSERTACDLLPTQQWCLSTAIPTLLRTEEKNHHWEVRIGRGCLILVTISRHGYRVLSHPIWYFKDIYDEVFSKNLLLHRTKSETKDTPSEPAGSRTSSIDNNPPTPRAVTDSKQH
jgi:hypothetical protein